MKLLTIQCVGKPRHPGRSIRSIIDPFGAQKQLQVKPGRCCLGYLLSHTSIRDGRPGTDCLFRREDPRDPRAGEDDRACRRVGELEPPQLFRDEVPAGQRLSRDPGQSGHRRQAPARRDGLCVAARHPRQSRHGRRVPPVRGRGPDRRGRDRHRRQGRVDATWRSARRGGEDGGGRRARSDHEPLPEDRVRAAWRRIVVERRQQRHHPEPPARGAACPPHQEPSGAAAQS